MLRSDDIQDINKIAQQIAKKESGALDLILQMRIETMDKALKAEINRLEAEVKDTAAKVIELGVEIKDLKAEIKRVREVTPIIKSLSKK